MADGTASGPGVRGHGSFPASGLPMATAVAETLRRHREAIALGEPAAIARWTEELSWLLPGLNAALAQAASVPVADAAAGAGGSALAAAARELQEAVQMNLMMAQNGLIIAHHFAVAVAEASSVDDPALFAGVA